MPTTPTAWGPDNPFWDVKTQSVYFGDVLGAYVYRYSLEDDKVYSTTADGLTRSAFLVPINGSSTKYLATTNGTELVIFEWDGYTSTSTIVETISSLPPDQNINNFYVTPYGHIYFGTYAPTLCNTDSILPLYHWSENEGLVEIDSNFKSTTGSFLIGDILYQLDGCATTLYAFTYNSATGSLSIMTLTNTYESKVSLISSMNVLYIF